MVGSDCAEAGPSGIVSDPTIIIALIRTTFMIGMRTKRPFSLVDIMAGLCFAAVFMVPLPAR
jgi:hypothetical protein